MNGNNLGNAQVGGLANDLGNSICSDQSGTLFIGGSIQDSAYFTNQSASNNVTTNIGKDAFIYQLKAQTIGISESIKTNWIQSIQTVSKNTFKIKLNDTNNLLLELFNLNGQIIEQLFINKKEFSIGAHLKAGSYLLRLTNQKQLKSFKIVKL